MLIQKQFAFALSLDHGNPTLANLKRDFGRFAFKLDFVVADPLNSVRLEHLARLNDWRNAAAHHGNIPAAGVPNLADLRLWFRSCDGLATSLDTIVYNQLRKLLRRKPWSL